MYQNLVRSVDSAAPDSVHLASWPEADPAQVDERLAEDMRLVMRIVSLGRAARSKAGVKVRQPLRDVAVILRSQKERDALAQLRRQVLEELNVKDMEIFEDVEAFYRHLGPTLSQDEIRESEAIRDRIQRTWNPAADETYPLDTQTEEFAAIPGYPGVVRRGCGVFVSERLDSALKEEGIARELVRRLQVMRRNAGFEIADRIVTYYQGGDALRRVMQRFADYVRQETLSLELVEGEPPPDAHVEAHTLDGQEVTLGVRQAG
jgi:isoleucyl-tRNA synthetase